MLRDRFTPDYNTVDHPNIPLGQKVYRDDTRQHHPTAVTIPVDFLGA